MHFSWQVSINASLGTFNVAATVDQVLVKGDGTSHMTLTSSMLLALNRQLLFVTYTNTVFHPRTADTGDTGTSLFAAVNVFAHLLASQKNVFSLCSPIEAPIGEPRAFEWIIKPMKPTNKKNR